MRYYILVAINLIALAILISMLVFNPNNSVQDDMYIEILKFGKTNLGIPISYNQLESHLDDIGIEYDKYASEYLFASMYFDENNLGGNSFPIPRDSVSFYLNVKGYSELLNHNELEEARSSSNQAFLISAIAVLVSILLVLIAKLPEKKRKPKIKQGDCELAVKNGNRNSDVSANCENPEHSCDNETSNILSEHKNSMNQTYDSAQDHS